jgi:YidC/Oxa1 family membrane protein insertase
VLTGLTKTETIDGVKTFNPGYLDQDSALFKALDASSEMVSWGMDLAKSASSSLSDKGAVTALPYLILVGLVVLTSWYQQRQVQGRNPNAAANPQQQMIGKIMPFIFVPISFSLPAGVVIYFVVSNGVRIGQQALVTRLEFGPDKGGTSENGAKPKASPPPAPPAPKPTGKPAPSPRTTAGQHRARNKKKRK